MIRCIKRAQISKQFTTGNYLQIIKQITETPILDTSRIAWVEKVYYSILYQQILLQHFAYCCHIFCGQINYFKDALSTFFINNYDGIRNMFIRNKPIGALMGIDLGLTAHHFYCLNTFVSFGLLTYVHCLKYRYIFQLVLCLTFRTLILTFCAICYKTVVLL